MSVTSNEPILLNATATDIATELEIQNGYLSIMASGKRSTIYENIEQIAHVVRSNPLDVAKKLLPVGDQIIVPWKDLDDSAHNTDETAYQVAWDFLDVREVTKKDGSVVPGLVLGMHLCSAYGVQFSHQQAFYHADSALAAGTYYFIVNTQYGDNIPSGSLLEFTTTKELPAEGRIYMDTSKNVQLYAAGSTTSIETVTAAVVTSSSGTNLGTTGSNGLNTKNNMQYGHNRYSTSAIRQYLNASGNNWWKSQEDFDIRPDQYAKHGFMSGFNDDFLSAIKPIKVVTALNTVEGFADATEETYDTFFLPSLEEINATSQLSGAEGPYFPYWRERLGLNKFAGLYSSNIYDAYKIPAINSSSPHIVRLRSAYRHDPYYTWGVSSSGYVSHSYYACSAYRFSPACVIC